MVNPERTRYAYIPAGRRVRFDAGGSLLRVGGIAEGVTDRPSEGDRVAVRVAGRIDHMPLADVLEVLA